MGRGNGWLCGLFENHNSNVNKAKTKKVLKGGLSRKALQKNSPLSGSLDSLGTLKTQDIISVSTPYTMSNSCITNEFLIPLAQHALRTPYSSLVQKDDKIENYPNFLQVPKQTPFASKSTHPAKYRDSLSLPYSKIQSRHKERTLSFCMKNILKIKDEYEFKIPLESLPDQLQSIMSEQLQEVSMTGNQNYFLERSHDLEYEMRKELKDTYNEIDFRNKLNESKIIGILSNSLRKEMNTNLNSCNWTDSVNNQALTPSL